MIIELTLPWPPSNNVYYRHVVIGRSARVLLSAEARAYHRRCALEAVSARPLKRKDGPLRLLLLLYPPDHRLRDIDNALKALLDTLTRLGVWFDDSQVKRLEVEMLNPAKPGRVIVQMEEW